MISSAACPTMLQACFSPPEVRHDAECHLDRRWLTAAGGCLDQYQVIIDGYYAQYACQFVVCAFTAFLLLRLGTWNPQPLMRWWGLAWAALAIYIACAGLGLKLVVDGRGATSPDRIILGGVALFAGLAHVGCFVLGWRAERRGSDRFPRRAVVRYGALLLLCCLLIALPLHLLASSPTRFFVKVTLRGLLVFAAFSWVGIALLRYRELMPLIRFWLGSALLAFAAKHLHYAWLTHFGTEDRYLIEYYLQFIELGLHTVMAGPVLLWVCLGFVRETTRQATELGRMDQKIREQERLLEQRQRLASIGRMASGIAHDFNNILSVILGWTDVLRHGSQLDRTGRKGIDAIEAAAGQAGEISKKLLLFGGNRQLTPSVVSVAGVVREAIGMANGLQSRKLGVRIEEGLSPAWVDRSLLLVSVQNLLINAVEATTTKDTISIRVCQVRPTEEFCLLHKLKPGPYLKVEVADSGMGIPSEILDQIWEPFFTTKEKGTGLGLASVHGFLKQSGGGIEILSLPGQGTTFSMWIPVLTETGGGASSPEGERPAHRPASAASEAAAASEPRSPGPTGCIVVVDDEKTIAKFLSGVLTRAGHEVICRNSPREALAECRRLGSRLSLLVSDVRMPEMPGMELAPLVLQACPEAGIVFVTGFADDVDSDRIPSLRPPAVLQKPITGEELLRAVESQLESAISVR